MNNPWRSEPTLLINAIKALIALAIGFGLDLSVEQFGLLMVAITAVMAVVNRQTVYAPDTVEAMKDRIQRQTKAAETNDIVPPPAL